MKIPFFKNKNPTTVGNVKLISQYGNTYYAWNGKIFESDIIRSCVRPYASAIGKLNPKHISYTQQGNMQIDKVPYMRMLLQEPNPYMTMQMFLEKMANILETNNNAFALIFKDENGYPLEIYPINCVGAEAIYSESGELFLKFSLLNGKMLTVAYENIIHLRNDYNTNDIFGTPFGETLTSLMTIVTTTDQGIVNAIKNSAIIRWLLKYQNALRPEDLKKNADDFAANFLSTEKNGTGVAAVGSEAEVKQIETKDYVPNASQMDRTTNRIYNLFGTNEKIIQSKFSEDDWNAYYESKIEPTALQLSNEFTRKLFTRRERGTGNKIMFESSSLQYASMKTKLDLMQMVDRGAMTPNEWRQVMNLGPIEGGDKVIRRLDTAVVNQVKALIDKLNNENYEVIGNAITQLLMEGGK